MRARIPLHDQGSGQRGEAAGPAQRASALKQAAERTRRNIIEIATEEFAHKGFSGARIDEIAARTNTSKRMLYYYFVDKQGLFIAVLEEAYRRFRALETTLAVEHLDPEAAMRSLVALTFDNHVANEAFVRLVMTENIHRGAHLEQSRTAHDLNVPIIETTRSIYRRGVKSGTFRPGIDIIDLHMTISALCFHMVANRSTFSRIFRRDMSSRAALQKRREVVVDTVMRYLKAE